MKITELIIYLEELRKENGDIDVKVWSYAEPAYLVDVDYIEIDDEEAPQWNSKIQRYERKKCDKYIIIQG